MTLIEVIEHIDLEYLMPLSEVVFGYYNPELVLVTTPNADFNFYFKQKNP